MDIRSLVARHYDCEEVSSSVYWSKADVSVLVDSILYGVSPATTTPSFYHELVVDAETDVCDAFFRAIEDQRARTVDTEHTVLGLFEMPV